MSQSSLLSSYQLEDFIQKLEKTCSQLLKEIRKYGEDNVSTRFYLEQFKNFQRQLELKMPLKETFTCTTLQTTGDQQHEQPNHDKSHKTPMTDYSLKPAVRRQLVLIQSQETKCQEICKLISNVEEQIRQINSPEESVQPNPQEIKDKLLPVYSIVQGWLKDLSKIVEDMVVLLQNHLQSFQTPSISFEKSIISPDSNRRSALTSILQSMNRSDKNKSKFDLLPVRQTQRSSKIQKRIISKFDIVQQPCKPAPKQIKPQPVQKHCTECILF